MDVLEKIGVGPFRPLAFLTHPFAQTIAGAYLPQGSDLNPTAVHEVVLPDNDRVILIENRPLTFQPGRRCVLLVHGLMGCHASSYMVRLTRRLVRQGVAVFRLNLRNCGPGFGLAKKPYHAGMGEDARFVLQWLKERWPDSPVTLIGFSLGGNLSLKMAGEDGSRPSGNLDSLIAVSPPIDLAKTAKRMRSNKNKFFDDYFARLLKRDVQRLHKMIDTSVTIKAVLDVQSIWEFDETYTAPIHGFTSAEDYYRKCSGQAFIANIKIPTLILASLDDPIVETREVFKLPKQTGLDLVLTRHGGHLGFIGFDRWYNGYWWMDRVIINWVQHLMPTSQWLTQPNTGSARQLF